FTFCAAATARSGSAPDDLARLRARGTTRVVIGAVVLSLGIILGGTSAALWIAGSGYSFDYNTDYKVAVAMDVVGFAAIGAVTAVLALGAGDLASARRPKVAFGPTSFSVRF